VWATFGKDYENQVVKVFVADDCRNNLCRGDGGQAQSVLIPRDFGWCGVMVVK
jgi:hypothetical protein